MTQPLSPDHAKLLLNVFLPALQREQATTRKIIEAIPLDHGDYRPDAFAKSALELAWHIAVAEKRFFNGIADGGFDFSPLNRPESVNTSADIGRWYGEMCDSVQARLAKMTPEQLAKVLDFRGVFQMPAVVFFQTAISHSIHHRGQLSVYLRPMGGKVPAIYGESYDSAESRKAAESKSAQAS
ncbi:MAG TPA: DinB family protein [Candidatus Angelobacter sp.]|nr:DinB family protein [Candidatus Angelobacter sp.]